MNAPASRVLLSTLALVALGACSTYEPFHTIPHLEQQYTDRLPADLVDEVTVPFELSEDVREALVGRMRNPSARDELKVDYILDFIFTTLELEYSLTPTRDANEVYAAGIVPWAGLRPTTPSMMPRVRKAVGTRSQLRSGFSQVGPSCPRRRAATAMAKGTLMPT